MLPTGTKPTAPYTAVALLNPTVTLFALFIRDASVVVILKKFFMALFIIFIYKEKKTHPLYQTYNV
jgi:hypothetical protein